MLRPVFRQSRRGLFKSLKNAPRFKEEKDSKHHEYSIRPDTFAFRVGHGENKNSKAHPLQDKGETLFNVIEYIYKNATNYPFAKNSPQDVFDKYPETNSAKMGRMKHRPRKVKMLASDFIEDSLYNPHYGYFSKEVEIFHSDEPFDYNSIDDVDAFMDAWQQAYSKYEQREKHMKEPKAPEAEPEIAKERKDAKQGESTTQGNPKQGQNLQQGQNKQENTNKSQSFLSRQAQLIRQQDLAVASSRKSLQLWHTPTELFSPHYAEALARYIVVNYKLNQYPYHDLVIFEMGGGNGTLMCNILQYIQRHEPDIYRRTQYKIIEISSQLALKQYSQAMKLRLVSSGLDERKLQIINKSIFRWDTVVEEPCFFIALEVFDNFAHDVVRYDLVLGVPYQGYVLVDDAGDFYEFFSPQLSPDTNALLSLRENGRYPVLPQQNTILGHVKRIASMVPFYDKSAIHPLLQLPTKLQWSNKLLPLKDNMTPGEFVPTRLLHFFNILKHRFPNHSLISSDFHSLPNAIPGYYNAPVVQTVVGDRMVDVSTYMCHQGYFDIMFPTDFALASDLYRQVTGKLAKVELHREFLEQWADVDATTTKKGENPMLDFYKNVSFMVS